jgi:hypothetical protein
MPIDERPTRRIQRAAVRFNFIVRSGTAGSVTMRRRVGRCPDQRTRPRTELGFGVA